MGAAVGAIVPPERAPHPVSDLAGGDVQRNERKAIAGAQWSPDHHVCELARGRFLHQQRREFCIEHQIEKALDPDTLLESHRAPEQCNVHGAASPIAYRHDSLPGRIVVAAAVSRIGERIPNGHRHRALRGHRPPGRLENDRSARKRGNGVRAPGASGRRQRRLQRSEGALAMQRVRADVAIGCVVVMRQHDERRLIGQRSAKRTALIDREGHCRRTERRRRGRTFCESLRRPKPRHETRQARATRRFGDVRKHLPQMASLADEITAFPQQLQRCLVRGNEIFRGQ